jgi:hypothetical protein
MSIAILSFASFCKEHPDKAFMIFERKDEPGVVHIWLDEEEKKKYREFLSRHGYERQESLFVSFLAKNVLFREMEKYDLAHGIKK